MFSTIQHLLLDHLQDIEDISTKEHLKYLGTSGLRMEKVKQHRNRYMMIVRDIANNLDYSSLDDAIKTVKKSGKALAKQSLADGLTIEEATNGISFLKEIIWREIEKAHLLDNLTVAEYHKLNQTLGMLIDSVGSQIAFSYHEYYREAELQQQQLAAIVNWSEDAIIGKDLKSTITSWNNAAEKMFGYTAREAIGHNISLIIPPELLDEEDEIINGINRGRATHHYQTVRVAKDGRRINVSLTVSPVKSSKGEVFGASSIMRDITLQKRAEQALRENQELLDTFFQNTPAGLIIYDENNRYVRINAHAAALYGIQPEQAVGKTIFEVLPADLAKLTEERNRQVLETGKPATTRIYSAKLPLNPPRAKMTYWQGVRFPVPLPGGKMGVGVFSMDITGQIIAQEKVRESEEKFTKAFSSNPAAIAITNLEDGLFSDVNQTWIDLQGYSREEAIGHTSKELSIWPNDRDRKRFVEELLNKRQIRGWEQDFRKKSGELFTAQLSAQIMEAGGHKLVISTLIDITERKKLERQKDEFLGVASHELKTPVTSIKAYTQVLQLAFQRKKDLQAVGLLGKLDIQIDKLNSLIADLLDVTRIESGKMQFRQEYFDFNSLISEVVEEIQRTTPRHAIVSELDCSRMIYGDRERIAQAITNLLTNAVKYSPKAQQVRLFTKCNHDTITLCVQDFGIGIPKEKQTKVFDRFYRIERDEGEDTYPGLGLGLYISAEIIKREGGTIWVESEINKGSLFCFSLPQDNWLAKKPKDVLRKEIIKYEK